MAKPKTECVENRIAVEVLIDGEWVPFKDWTLTAPGKGAARREANRLRQLGYEVQLQTFFALQEDDRT